MTRTSDGDDYALDMVARHGRLERRTIEWSDGPRVYWFQPPDFLVGVADATIQSLASRGLVRLEGDVCHALRPAPPRAPPRADRRDPPLPPRWTPPGRLV